jgi:hypothetical protein
MARNKKYYAIRKNRSKKSVSEEILSRYTVDYFRKPATYEEAIKKAFEYNDNPKREYNHVKAL